jgi:hypothetical protein
MISGFSLDEEDSGFVWNVLYFNQMEYDFGIRTLRSLIVSQEMAFAKIRDDFQKKMDEDKVLNSSDPYNGSMHYEHFYSDQKNMIEEIEILQRYSMCVSYFSFFESRLKEICEFIESNFEFEKKVKDFCNNNNICGYWKYLIDVFEISKKTECQYTPIINRYEIRNIITHQNGIPKAEQFNSIKYIKHIKITNSSQMNRISIMKGFNEGLLTDINKFLFTLVKVVDERYKAIAIKSV